MKKTYYICSGFAFVLALVVMTDWPGLALLFGLTGGTFTWLGLKSNGGDSHDQHRAVSQPKTIAADEFQRHAAAQTAERLVELVNESLKIANESHNADTKISRLEFAKKKLDELKRLVEENPHINLTQLELVESDIRTLEFEFQQAHYQEAAEGNLKGQALEKEGKADEAIRVYEQLLETEVDTPFTYRRLAILYRKKRSREDELRVLKAAIRNVPSANSSHYQWFAERLSKMS
jgi:tetratricopeptide (TPR) repeat protein